MQPRFTATIIGLVHLVGCPTHASAPSEAIYYFDSKRPPLIELFTWDEKKHWQLHSVKFDSDGDWALDTTMDLSTDLTGLNAADREAWRKRDEQFGGVTRDGVRFVPFDKQRRNTIR